MAARRCRWVVGDLLPRREGQIDAQEHGALSAGLCDGLEGGCSC
jgi:hypothetical protein